ncbi:MAG TPA: hypothetical protein VMU34_18675 [Mycobacterium sp.]|nr:hypothetical protein [Mycobacterium sp.]
MTDSASVDALVAAIHPGVTGPGIETGDTVLVTGPWLAGSTSIAAALRRRIPGRSFAEVDELPAGESPVAVVFVTPAVAPLSESDCALLDTAAANTDLVIGAVSKIDAYDNWRDVLAADRKTVTTHDPRYRDVAWVGVAAAPEQGEPALDELVESLKRGLDDAGLARRNRLRTWQNRLREAVRRHDDDVAGVGREARMATLREQRSEMQQRRQLTESEQIVALRGRINRAQDQLTDFARHRCMSVQGELQEDAGTVTRRRLPSFENYVGNRVGEVAGEVDAGITKQLADLATELGLTQPDDAPPPRLPERSSPTLPSRRLRTVMVIVGAVVGLCAAVAVIRVVPQLSPPYYTAAVLAAGVVLGIGVAGWAGRVRGVQKDRAVVRRWVDEVIDEFRRSLQSYVTERVRSAEPTLTAEQARRDEAEAADLEDRIEGIDAELREHASAARTAETLRSRELPPLQRALQTVQSELDGSGWNARPGD